MASGSIYIDPDGVSGVSKQMLMTADEIDALRRSIVTQVDEVITSCYPAVGQLPDGAYSLGSAQDSIGSFDYRAKILAQDISTAAYVLNQVAEEGRVMMEQLLRQATMFTPPGQGGGSGSIIDSLLHSIDGVGSPILNTLKSLFQSEPVKTGADVLGSILTIAQEIAKSDPSLAKSMEGIPWIGPVLMVAGTALDVVSNGNYDPRIIGGDLTGAVIAEGLDDVPGVGEVVGAITLAGTIDHLEAMTMSYGEKQYAQLFSGDEKDQLLQTSENLQATAENANPGKVFDSIGLTTYDSLSGNYGALPSDLLNTAITGGKFALSFPQMDVNASAAIANDTLAGVDKGVSNVPFLPGFIKAGWHDGTVVSMHVINDTADVITHPIDTAKKAWDAATGWL